MKAILFAAAVLASVQAHAQEKIRSFALNGATFLSFDAREKIRIPQMRRHIKWGPPTLGTGAVITWSYLTEASSYPSARNCSQMAPVANALRMIRISAFEDEVWAALRLWSDASNVQFKFVANSELANIVIGSQSEPEGRAFADIFPKKRPLEETDAIVKSLICLNPLKGWVISGGSEQGAYALRRTIEHEVGHALGYDHHSRNGVMAYKYLDDTVPLVDAEKSAAIRVYGPPKKPPSG